MSLAHGILGFLTYGEMSGYDLTKAFGSSLDFFWHAQNSHIYLELKKLEHGGYIEGTVVEQQEKPNKRVYRLTDAGRKEFFRWLGEKDSGFSREFKSSFLMKVFFSGNVPPAQSIAMLQGFIAGCEDYLKELSQTPRHYLSRPRGADCRDPDHGTHGKVHVPLRHNEGAGYGSDHQRKRLVQNQFHIFNRQ